MSRHATFVAAVAALLVVMGMIPAGATPPTITYGDGFKSQGFGGNQGNTKFSGPWLELGESDGPTSGVVSVWDHEYCNGKYCAQIGGEGADIAGHGLVREVDIAGAKSATLTFAWGRQLLGESGGLVTAEISADGGETWAVLRTFALEDDDGVVEHTEKIDITEWAASHTQIRFVGNGDGANAYFLFDDVKIEADLAPVTTTTTAPPTTTTTTAATTTTTAATTTTTTTTPPPTTTTTLPADRIQEVPPPPPPVEPPHAGGDVPSGVGQLYRAKHGLAITESVPALSVPGLSVSQDGAASTASHPQGLSPIGDLMASFTTSSERLGGNAVTAIVLGILIAALAVRGLRDRRVDPSSR